MEQLFLSTPSARRATFCSVELSAFCLNFYPRPPRGGRQKSHSHGTFIMCNFYPRPPRGGRRAAARELRAVCHFYPRPPRGGRPQQPGRPFRDRTISIHALREEGDLSPFWAWDARGDFYPRPPRGGRRYDRLKAAYDEQFLSTPSARRATMYAALTSLRPVYFYPRPPRGGRRLGAHRADAVTKISIHALREEGDLWPQELRAGSDHFYPRPPRGGRRTFLRSTSE